MASFKNVFLYVLILSLFLFGRSNPYKLEESFTKSIPFNSNGKVEIESANGKIFIEGWDKDEVYIEAKKMVEAESCDKAKEIMQEIEIVVEHQDDAIRIHARLPKDNKGNFLDWIFGNDVSYSVSYTLHVPASTNIDASSTNGELYISQVEGNLRFSTTNGGIRGENLSGNVNAHTTNGSLKIEIEKVFREKEMEFTTTNGSITVSLPSDINCNIKAETTNGSTRTDFPFGSRVSTIERKFVERLIRVGQLSFLRQQTEV
jgi:DUF4097 and DUF4098 domain-containing protein YvlB